MPSMKLMPDRRIVPALMFHSVGLHDHDWPWPELAEPPASFERKMALFKRKGFSTVFWRDLQAYMDGRRSLPPRSILLTFDDGYLDNWVFAYPILKRIGFKATIFVNPDFVDPAPEPRPTLEDVWNGRCRLQDLQVAGFLSWAEMREMEASGLVDIQSHALTHTWYFAGPRIVDFHAPETARRHPWLSWNARPERKPYYLSEDQSSFVPWGYPVLEHEKSLTVRRFLPDETAMDLFPAYVRERGGEAFLRHPEWRRELFGYARTKLAGKGMPGEYETEEARRERIRHELVASKQALETHLGKQVDYICWPGGGNDPLVRALAAEVGYKAWTYGSREALDARNLPGSASHAIKRIGTSNRIELAGRLVGTGGAYYQLMRVLAHQRSAWWSALLRLYKALAATRLVGAS